MTGIVNYDILSNFFIVDKTILINVVKFGNVRQYDASHDLNNFT